MKKLVSVAAVVLIMSFLAGCGETVHGMVKDTKRIGGGVRQVFVRD
jgi:predicted small secreted protein